MAGLQSWQRFKALEELMADNARPECPVVISIVVSLGEDVTRDQVVETLVGRLLTHPRFCSTIVKRNGRHHFERVPGFTMEVASKHVLEETVDMSVSHKEQVQLFNDRVAELMGVHMDKERPLWRVHLFRKWSLQGEGQECSTLLLCVHHSISDGIGLVKFFLASIVDDGRIDMIVAPQRQKKKVPPKAPALKLERPSPLERMSLAVQDVYNGTLGLLVPDPKSTLTQGEMSGAKACALIPAGKFSVKQLKKASRALGVTINDLLHAALTGAVREYLQVFGDDVDHLKGLRCTVPINRHMLKQFTPSDVVNQVALLALDMDIRESDPIERVKNSAQMLNRVKGGFQPGLTMLMLDAVARMPRVVRNPLWKWLTRASSLIFTNVPGPREHVTVGGVPVKGVYFFAPTDGECALVASFFSYEDEVCMGLSADKGRIPRLDVLADALEQEIELLIKISHSEVGAES